MTEAGHQRGFTLIETIIAMVVLALVMVLLTGALRFVTAGWDRGARAAEAGETIALVQGLLRREAAAAPRLTWRGGAEPAVAFLGEADRLGLVVVDPGFPGDPGLAVAIFRSETAAGTTALRYARGAFDARLGDFAAATISDDLILARGSARFAFDYFGTVPGATRPRWISPWPDRQSRPLLIRLRSRDPATGGALWPDIVVPLTVDAEAACVRARLTADEVVPEQQPAEQPETTGEPIPDVTPSAAATPPADGADPCSLPVPRDGKTG